MKQRPAKLVLFDQRYPARRLLDLIGDKWTPIILFCLSGGVRRFGEFQGRIPDISKKMLTKVLRQLESDGLVDRKVYQEVPPKTEYSLTAKGRRIHQPISAMCRWALDNEDLVSEIARKRVGASRG